MRMKMARRLMVNGRVKVAERKWGYETKTEWLIREVERIRSLNICSINLCLFDCNAPFFIVELFLFSIRSDARLFTNDQDIKYSKALDSSRLPRVRNS